MKINKRWLGGIRVGGIKAGRWNFVKKIINSWRSGEPENNLKLILLLFQANLCQNINIH